MKPNLRTFSLCNLQGQLLVALIHLAKTLRHIRGVSLEVWFHSWIKIISILGEISANITSFSLHGKEVCNGILSHQNSAIFYQYNGIFPIFHQFTNDFPYLLPISKILVNLLPRFFGTKSPYGGCGEGVI